jgi:hypothetical protein
VDDQEARDGTPRNLFHKYPYDRGTLAARFPEHEDSILEAQPHKSESGSLETESDQITIYEAWRLP